MTRLLAIDYGAKRCGLAVSDELQIIATTLGYQDTSRVIQFLKDYFDKETVETIVLGYPVKMDGTDTDSTPLIREFRTRLEKEFADKRIVLQDESGTSKDAVAAMVQGGMKKKKRREKGNVDAIAATLILQSYMESR